jgi:hypothetical protein
LLQWWWRPVVVLVLVVVFVMVVLMVDVGHRAVFFFQVLEISPCRGGSIEFFN